MHRLTMHRIQTATITLGFALALTPALTPIASATPQPATLTAQRSTPNNQAVAALKRMGFEYAVSEKDPNTLIFQLDGYRVLLINYPNGFQLYSGFQTDGKVSLDRINVWNREKRFSRAYLDSRDDAVLESDLDLEGGVSDAAIDEFIRTYRGSLRGFVKHIAP
jgi:hypothetical protein